MPPARKKPAPRKTVFLKKRGNAKGKKKYTQRKATASKRTAPKKRPLSAAFNKDGKFRTPLLRMCKKVDLKLENLDHEQLRVPVVNVDGVIMMKPFSGEVDMPRVLLVDYKKFPQIEKLGKTPFNKYSDAWPDNGGSDADDSASSGHATSTTSVPTSSSSGSLFEVVQVKK